MQKKNTKESQAWYALRRTLPLWNFEENLQELIDKLPEYKVDELIVKVDTEEFFHGQIPLDWLRNYQSRLFHVKAEMEKLGIVYSLNPWITQGHADRGRIAQQQLPGVVTYVGHDGSESTCCACALSSVWRKNTAEAWKIYAETKPHIMWVEDDIRTFNHGAVKYGCFCELHMKKFSELLGEKVAREQLVQAILKPGKPHPWRKIYLDMQADIMIETAQFIARTVHEVSPDTCMGLMSSGPENHCLEGRHWGRFAEALADGTTLYSRPPMGNYSENNLRDLCFCPHSIKITRHCLPEKVIEQTEVENFTFTQYAKSSAITFLQMAISFAYGSHGLTMNLFDHMGNPMELFPAYGKMLAEKKEYFNALAEYSKQPGTFCGVKLLHKNRSSYDRILPDNADYQDLTEDGLSGATMFESFGIANGYGTSSVTAAFGQTLRSYSDIEINEMLKNGLYLDGVAATVLFERGFGQQIGLKSISEMTRIDNVGPFSAEEYFNIDFGGKDKQFMTLVSGPEGLPYLSILMPIEQANIISCLVDPNAKRHHPLMYAYENELGGRVIVSAFDIETIWGNGFCNQFRRDQLHSAIDWLSQGKPDLLVKSDVGYTLSARKDCKDFTLLSMFNLSLDPWSQIECKLQSQIPSQILILKPNGEWRKATNIEFEQNNDSLIIKFKHKVKFDEPLFMLLKC